MAVQVFTSSLDCCKPHFALSKRHHHNGFISLAFLSTPFSLNAYCDANWTANQMIADLAQELMCFSPNLV